MPIYNFLLLVVVVIVVEYGSVNYACVWKKRGSTVEAVWQGGKGFGIGGPPGVVLSSRFAHGAAVALVPRARWPDDGKHCLQCIGVPVPKD